jgi:hypothetical protein
LVERFAARIREDHRLLATMQFFTESFTDGSAEDKLIAKSLRHIIAFPLRASPRSRSRIEQ